MLAPAKVGGLRERRESERNKLQPQRFLKPTPRPAPILADDADTPSLAVAFDKLGLPDAARCAARFGCDRPYAWQWQALRQGVAHKNLVYSAPASGGKTLVAEALRARAREMKTWKKSPDEKRHWVVFFHLNAFYLLKTQKKNIHKMAATHGVR